MPLSFLLVVAVLAVLGGARSLAVVAQWVRNADARSGHAVVLTSRGWGSSAPGNPATVTIVLPLVASRPRAITAHRCDRHLGSHRLLFHDRAEHWLV